MPNVNSNLQRLNLHGTRNMKAFRIVIADDDEDDYFLIREALEKFVKHTIDSVNNGQQLLDYLHHKIKSHEILPDLILLDINMPNVNGIDALKLIRSSEILKCLPVLMYSTSNDPDQIELCKQLGANGFISKAGNHNEMTRNVNTINIFLNDLAAQPLKQLFIR